MLVTKPLDKEIAILKLCTSDEVICTIVKHNDTSYVVESPYVLVMAPNGGAQYSPMLIMGADDTDVEIMFSSVVAKAVPSKNMKDSYEKATSKIIVPTKSSIII